jgi:sugar phosphate isomerase/epimerase
MKAGISCWCFNPLLTSGEMTLAGAVDFVAHETEAECFELLSRFWDPSREELGQARDVRDRMDRVGLTASCYTLDSDFAVYDSSGNRACIDRCVAQLETAVVLGAPAVRLDPRTSLPPDREGEVDLDDVLARVSQGMAEIADAAKEKGLAVGVENHGSLLGRTGQTATIVERVDRPNFGVVLDFTNFRIVFGEDHVEATRTLADRVIHVHAKDYHLSRTPRQGEGWRLIPSGEYAMRAVGGDGDAQWSAVIRILKGAGYDGSVSLEITDPADIKGSVAAGVSNLKRVLADVETADG